MSYLTYRAVSHKGRVCALYKRSLRVLETIHFKRLRYRYNAILLRARFDQYKDETDLKVARKLLLDGEEECFLKAPIKMKIFPDSQGGIADRRYAPTPDWLVDFWHPVEKAKYPDYMARREIRKREYIEKWVEKYGKPDPERMKMYDMEN